MKNEYRIDFEDIKVGEIYIGGVKRNLYTNEREWIPVNLSTIESIRGLLKFRVKFKYDITYKKMFCFDMYQTENNFEILCLYNWLDEMIKKCNFTDKQKQVLILYYLEGIKEECIVEILEMDERAVNGTLNSICRKILREVKLNYLMDYVYWDKVKIVKTKICSKCKKELPANENWFSPDNYRGGYMRYCKECR